MKRSTFFATAILLGLSFGCAEELQPKYSIRILGPSGQDPFYDATKVALEIGGAQRAVQTITPGEPFTLSLEGIRPKPGDIETIGITAFNAAGLPVAHGESPPIEIVATPTAISVSVFVQRYGTFAPGYGQLEYALRHMAVTSIPASSSSSTYDVPILFGGEYLVFNQDGTFVPQILNSAFVFNPALNAFEIDLGATSVAPRYGASIVATKTGSAIAFGGKTADTTAPFSGIGETYTLQRLSPVDIGVTPGPPMSSPDPGAARAFAAMAEADVVYAFGGIGRAPTGETIALDTIVRIDPANPTPSAAISVLPTKMAGTRKDFTVTSTITSGMNSTTQAILIFGGLDPTSTASVAELFVPSATPSLVPKTGEGGNRIAHSAVLVPDGRILFIGGANSDGSVRGDVVAYTPTAGTFGDAGFALAVPRRDATAFVAGNELVVSGGRDQAGTPIATVEIFDTSTKPFTALPKQTGAARYGAGVARMPDNKSILVVGGIQKPAEVELPSAAVEFYRPR
jgi:Galactose oxidase, central domain